MFYVSKKMNSEDVATLLENTLYDCQIEVDSQGSHFNVLVVGDLFEGVDIVFHLACLARVQPSIEDPITTNEVNINGFLNVLIASSDVGVKRFVYACSSSTYGDHPELPKVEENPVLRSNAIIISSL